MVETNQTAKPVPTNVKDLYAELEKEALTGSNRGQRAEIIRTAVENAAKQIGKTRLASSAVYKIIKAQLGESPKVDRSYFNNVITKAWETSKDDKGVVWVDISKPIIK